MPIIGRGVFGATVQADEMPGHLSTGMRFRQAEAPGIDIEMALRPAIAAVDL
jgi:hypothetical protein